MLWNLECKGLLKSVKKMSLRRLLIKINKISLKVGWKRLYIV